MKKILITFFIFIFGINFANADCAISSGPSEGLQKYFNNLGKILNNINSQANSIESDPNAYYTTMRSYAIRVSSNTFNFSNYFQEINFTAFSPLWNEIPKEFKRDYERLKQNMDKINSVRDNIAKRGVEDYNCYKSGENCDLNKICSGVDKCEFKDGTKLGDILEAVAINHKNIERIYLSYVSSKTYDTTKPEKKELFLVDAENFSDDLKNNYSMIKANGLQNDCIEGEKGGFFDQIKEKTTNIFTNNKYSKDGIEKWKEAWAMLNGIGDDYKENKEMANKEKELLQAELRRQGLATENQEAILNNLEKFNEDGIKSFFTNNLSNMVKYTKNSISDELADLKSEFSDEFLEKAAEQSKDGTIKILDATKAQENSEKIKDNKGRIFELYKDLKETSSSHEAESATFRVRLVNMHINLENSIELLQDTCKYSVKICNQQDSGNGKCGDCNW